MPIRSLRRLLLVACVLAVAPPVADAAPPDQQSARDAYLSLLDQTGVDAGWTGSTESCAPGTESDASIEATRTAVNILRDFAGLTPVAFDAELNRKALAAALMMRAAGQLSHDPGPDWPCYSSDGDEGAGRSNLYLGRSGAAAMIGYVDDAGVSSLGHRRWVLDPRAGTFGTGSTGTTNALLVIGGAAPAQPVVPELVSWPPAGHVPWSLVFTDWSAAISTPGTVDTSAATVTVLSDGQPLPVSGVTSLQDGFGAGETMKWNVEIGESAREAAHHVDVTIGNVFVDGVPRQYSYAFDTFPTLPPAPPVVRAVRNGDGVGLSWDAATERGVPVTGYRVIGQDGRGSSSQFDLSYGPEVRQAAIPYVQPGRTVYVSVIPLSRAGSPAVTPIALSPPPPPPPPPGSSTLGDSTTGGVSANMRVDRWRRVGRRLSFRVRITRRANGERIRAKVVGGGRKAFYRSLIRAGRARFNIRLSSRHRRARRLKVVVSFAGSSTVQRASQTWTFP